MFLLEFPQNLMGYLAFLYYTKGKKQHFYQYKDAYVTHVNGRWGAISLSRYIFCDDLYFESTMVKHEYGHTIQSKKLLFLYLPVIGLPSLVWNKCFRRYRRRNRISYYDFYTESSANRLGGFDGKVNVFKRRGER